MPKIIRKSKRILMVMFDVFIVVASIMVAFDKSSIFNFFDITSSVIVICSFVLVYLNHSLGLYENIQLMPKELTIKKLVISVSIVTALFVTLVYSVQSAYASLDKIGVFSFCLFSFLSIYRIILKDALTWDNGKSASNVMIFGAGSAGRHLSSAFFMSQDYRVVGFVDDDRSLHGKKVQNIRVYSRNELLSKIQQLNVSLILLAVPSVASHQRKDILQFLESLPVEVKTIASSQEIMRDQSKISEIKDIDIEDLLNRDKVDPVTDLMGKCVNGKVVLVTGAGGSIGSELCRQIIMHKPLKILLLDSSEYALYSIDQELNNSSLTADIDIVPIIGSVRDKNSMENVFANFSVDTIYHAAAYKHVPLVESNVVEGVKNNVFGTYICVKLAEKYKVSNFVLISTDKAVRPTNFMGASKRVSELILQAYATQDSETIFSMVRFGNVLGSSGSVVPLFKRQIEAGGPVTVTHKDIIRYFMTIPEAAQLVIQAGSMARGGEVFVLDMGKPVKIASLAKRLIHLMGYEAVNGPKNSSSQIEIKYTGLRPGEKLYEELLIGDDVLGTFHPRIMSANEDFLPIDLLEVYLRKLEDACSNNDVKLIGEILMSMPTQFAYKPVINIPSKSINDSKNIIPLKVTH